MPRLLTPTLRPLDERVLAVLASDRGRRASAVAKVTHGRPGGCGGHERRVLLVSASDAQEVREILRGLEHVGKAVQAGGWWRRV